MRENTGIFNSIQEYFGNISVLTSVMILIAIFTCSLIFWLIMRKSRLWYWKVDTQLDTLKRIDDRLVKLEAKLVEAEDINLHCSGQLEIKDEVQCEAKDKDEEKEETIPIETKPPFHHFVGNEKSVRKIGNVGRSGRVYTVEELQILIQD